MGGRRAKKRPFEYLICLDFEATCWPTAQNRKQDSEIIGKLIKFFGLVSKQECSIT